MTSTETFPRVAAVITAAGSGKRLGYGAPKALVPLTFSGQLGDDSSLLAVALRQVLGVRGIIHVVVTAPAEDVEVFREVVGNVPVADDVTVQVTEGSVSRQASVRNGLVALHRAGFGTEGNDVVLVHDAARAMAPTLMINTVVSAIVAGSAAAIPALPVADTLKLVDPETSENRGGSTERIVGSVDRTAMRIVQTPQGFPWRVLWAVHEQFAQRGMDEQTAATDDSTIAQWAGHAVDAVPGDQHALKVTTTMDLAVARVLYQQIHAEPAAIGDTNAAGNANAAGGAHENNENGAYREETQR